MSSITAAARRRYLSLASCFLVPLLSLGNSTAHAQQTASAEQLPPIEVSAPADQNRTRAKPTYDEGSGTRRVAPNPMPAKVIGLHTVELLDAGYRSAALEGDPKIYTNAL